jgi:hypothetical protein
MDKIWALTKFLQGWHMGIIWMNEKCMQQQIKLFHYFTGKNADSFDVCDEYSPLHTVSTE